MGLLNYFKSKKADNVKTMEQLAAAREQGYRSAEGVYANLLSDARKESRKALAEARSDFEKELDAQRIRLENVFAVRIAEQLKEISELREQLHKDRKAWNLIRDFFPEILHIIDKVKTVRFSAMEKSIQNYNEVGQWENVIQHIDRRLEKLTPRIEELMKCGIDVELIGK